MTWSFISCESAKRSSDERRKRRRVEHPPLPDSGRRFWPRWQYMRDPPFGGSLILRIGQGHSLLLLVFTEAVLCVSASSREFEGGRTTAVVYPEEVSSSGKATTPAFSRNFSQSNNNNSGGGVWAEGDQEDINSFYFYEAEQFTLLWILFAFIVAGNCAVLAALLLAKASRKSRMNFFIMHLALADLSVGLISVLTDIAWRITVSWNAGNVACKLIRFLQALVTYSSTYVLVALSIDRYDAIAHPMNFSGSWRRARILVAVAWALSALFSLPILILYHEKSIQGQLQCWIEFREPWEWQLYMTLVAAALFVIPALLISACYALILLTIWSKGQRLHIAASTSSSRSKAANSMKANVAFKKKFIPLGMNSHKRNCAVSSDQTSTGVLPPIGGDLPSQQQQQTQETPPSTRAIIIKRGCRKRSGLANEDEADSRRASSRGLIPRAKIKTVKMTFVIVFVFIICWSPYIIFDLLQVYGHIPRTQTNMAVATFIQSLTPLNSAANPIIYCLFSTRLCRGIRRCPLLSWFGSTSDVGEGGRCWRLNDSSSSFTTSSRHRRGTRGVNSFTTDTVSTASTSSTFRGHGSLLARKNSYSTRYRSSSIHKTLSEFNNAPSTMTSAV